MRRDSAPGRALSLFDVHLSDRDAWFAATLAAVLNGIGMLLEMAIILTIPGVPIAPAAVSASAAALLLMALFIGRKTPSVRWASVIYSMTTVSVVTVLLLTNLKFAEMESNWSPFQTHKLGCLAAALLAPGFSVGLLSIAAYGLSAVIQLLFFFPDDVKMAATPSEPWPMIAFILAGVLALVYRFRHVQLEQEIARTQAQNFAIKRLASAFLNIRDLMNTPLQVIELSVDLLRQAREPAAPALDRIDRSVQNLREINSVLVQHEKEIEWQTGQSVSPDRP
ncbi:MAG TPA: hypothetical protein VFY29_02315 [Terriglobia bacterium]|nr:hypothetical protein [Terriglobia bacterium]